jgi:hypothetical protein
MTVYDCRKYRQEFSKAISRLSQIRDSVRRVPCVLSALPSHASKTVPVAALIQKGQRDSASSHYPDKRARPRVLDRLIYGIVVLAEVPLSEFVLPVPRGDRQHSALQAQLHQLTG